MTETKHVPERRDMPMEETWDLSPLFKSDEAWEQAFSKLAQKIPKFEEFRGTLGKSAENLRACLEFEVEFDKEAERLGTYAFLRYSEDVRDTSAQAMVARYTHLATQASETASFLAPEIQRIPKKTMSQFLDAPELEPFLFTLEKFLRYRPHILSEKEERILAMQGEVTDTAEKVFSQLTDADMVFGDITNEKGEKIELTQSSLHSLLESRKRDVRRKAFHKFYAEIDAHKNTLATSLGSSVLQDVYQARVRNYSSSREAALFSDNMPVTVYDNLVQTVRDNLDIVHEYLEVRRKALRIKDIHMYDCYVPIVQLADTHVPYEEAVEQITAALDPLGKDYCATLAKGLSEKRWVDRYENKGKRSGAFCAGSFVGPPYILMNYRPDTLNSMFTLAHEAGHSMHTYFSARNQPYQYYDYAIFVAEVASTFNEQLLNNYLLERAPDDKTRAYLVSREIDEIRGTIIRQTMFAEFERIIHEYAEEGQPLTLDVLCGEYQKLLEAYFGPRFTIDDELNLEGLRIPHFYNAFYVYKYATGLSAAIALAQQVLNGGKEERERYLNLLRSGGSKYPLDILRDAGVDMEDPGPVNTAMARLRHLVSELEQLV